MQCWNRNIVENYYRSKLRRWSATHNKISKIRCFIPYSWDEKVNYWKPNTYEIYDYAEFLKNNDQFEDSIIYFSKVLNLVKPNDYLFSKASDGRGVAYERLGDWAKAESDLLNSLNRLNYKTVIIFLQIIIKMSTL